MPDLRHNPTRMQELIDHIRSREGSFPFFYCDSVGLVTIGTGHLVDTHSHNPADQQAVVQALFNTHGVTLLRPNGTVANFNEVWQDWQRVKRHGQTHPNLQASAYANVAQLRISNATVDGLLRGRLDGFIARMYQRRPFMLHRDERIQMAIVDARYNPAGIALYSTTPADLPRMWHALDDGHQDFDLERALQLFKRIWKGRSTARYQQRHRLRVAMFKDGVDFEIARSRGEFERVRWNPRLGPPA